MAGLISSAVQARTHAWMAALVGAQGVAGGGAGEIAGVAVAQHTAVRPAAGHEGRTGVQIHLGTGVGVAAKSPWRDAVVQT